VATGWLGFYWGKTIAEYQQQKDPVTGALVREWLEYFARKTPALLHSASGAEARPGGDAPGKTLGGK
jgi:hypothetical protein